MADADIKKIREILRHRGRSDLAELLQYSISSIDESSTYGSYLFSTLGTFEIYSPIENHEQLKKLSEDDKKAILDAVLEIYPPKEYSIEITDLQFYLDMDLEPEHEVVSCRGLRELDFKYVNEQIEKCEEKIKNRDYEGAIMNARSLIESVCLCILEEENKISYNKNMMAI